MPIPFISPIQAMYQAQNHDANLEGAQTTNALKRFQMQKEADEMQRMNALRAAMAQYVKPDNTVDYGGVAAELVRGGMPDKAIGFQPILEGQKLNDFYKNMGGNVDPMQLPGQAAQAGLGTQVPGFLELQRKIQDQRAQMADKDRKFSLESQNELMTPDGKGGYKINNQLLAAKNMIAKSGSSNTNIKVNSFTPASEEAQKDFMKETRENFSKLRDTGAMLQNIEKAKELVPSAKSFMGGAGNTKLAAIKLLNNSVGTNINTEGVQSAEELNSRLFTGVIEYAKKIDPNMTMQQQAMLQRALGSLDTDPNALANVLDVFGDMARDKVATHNTIVEDAEKRGVKFPHDPRVKIPAKAQAKDATKTAPSIQDLFDEARRRGLVK